MSLVFLQLARHLCSTCLLRRLFSVTKSVWFRLSLSNYCVWLASSSYSGPLSARTSSSIIINGVSTSTSRHIILCALNEPSPQLSSQLHMYGVCESWRGVLPSPAPAAHCGQVNRRPQPGITHCHSSTQVFTAILVDRMKTSQPAACQLSAQTSSCCFSFSPTLL